MVPPRIIRYVHEEMEHLWSPAGAIGGNRWQMEHPQKPLKQGDPQPVATHGKRFGAHGKEGVDPRWMSPAGVNKVITRATETGRNEMVSMSATNPRFAAGFSATPRRAETIDRRF
jgi:hypothetical protein